MNSLENDILYYINNYHFKKSEKVYIHCKIFREYKSYYLITIWSDEFDYKKSITLSKDKIREKKLNKILDV